jgi:hypothetical protein
MTIHQRRGSGTWYYWAIVAVVLAIVLVALLSGFATFESSF